MTRAFLLLLALATPASAETFKPKFDRAESVTPYQYFGEVTKVYDGDTVTVDVDLGFGVQITLRLRLFGIDAWEVKGDEKERGVVARDWLRGEILGRKITFVSIKDRTGKYGRYLAIIYTPEQDLSINDRLVLHGHAVHRDY